MYFHDIYEVEPYKLAAPTCPADTSAAVDEDGRAQQMPRPQAVHLLDAFCLFTAYEEHEVEEGLSGLRRSVVRPADELEMAHFTTLIGLQSQTVTANQKEAFIFIM